MKANKLTPWYPGKVKPVHIGIYERDFSDREVWYSKWDGSAWMISSSFPEQATRFDRVSDLQCLPWRGLKEQA